MTLRDNDAQPDRLHSSQTQAMRFGPHQAPVDERDLRLDACRGLALWFTFLDHIPDNPLSWITLKYYGFSDASEVFVFVSGFTCMVAYGGALAKQGWPTIIARCVRRAMEIYAAFLLLLVVYFAAIWLVGGGTRYLDETNTGWFFREPGPTLLHALLLQYAAVNTDILPTFVFLHIAFPASFGLCSATRMSRWRSPFFFTSWCSSSIGMSLPGPVAAYISTPSHGSCYLSSGPGMPIGAGVI